MASETVLVIQVALNEYLLLSSVHFDILLILLLFFLDVGDILVDHFLSHHLLLHTLRSKLLLVTKNLRIIDCEPS